MDMTTQAFPATGQPDATPPWRVWVGSALPEPEPRGRRLVTRIIAVCMAILTIIYLVWRLFYTIDPGSYLLGIPLWIAEVWALSTSLMFTFVLWDLDGPAVEPRYEGPAEVTVLIPTYNEPMEVLLPVIAAARRMKRVAAVWVLDDGRREWVQDECRRLDAVYRVRPDNEHGKAGNLNAALPDVTTPYVVVLDADHVPSPDFVPKVIGYFDDEELAVVQTPQDFYNQTSFEHEMLGEHLYSEEELFYRGMLAGRNRWNAAFWCGTGAMLRTQALREIGWIPTASVTEDILTTIELHKAGWKSVHHNEVLARGLAAANAEQYLGQRLRWGQGAMQVLRRERFVTRKGLTFPQRVAYFSTLTGWFDSWRAFLLLILPALSLLLGRTVLTGPWLVFVTLFTVTFILQRWGLSRLARGRANIWESTVFDAIRMPATMRATTTLFWMRPLKFQVTAKGKQGEARTKGHTPYLLGSTIALMVLAELAFVLDILGIRDAHYPQQSMAWVQAGWCLLNLAIVTSAVRRIRDDRFASERRSSYRIGVHGDAFIDDTPVTAADLSFGGALAASPVGFERGTEVTFKARGIVLQGTVTNRTVREGDYLISIRFYPGQEVDAARLTAPAMV